MKQRLQPYLAALEEEKERLAGAIAHLEAECRQDEANLEKVRLNIVGVFETLAKADASAAGRESDPWAAFVQRYQQRFEQIPAPWRQRLEKAVAHGDVLTRTVEECKLATVRQLWALFESREEK